MTEIVLSNIEIPLEPWIVLKREIAEESVSVLVDGGCNTNMLSTDFIERIRESLKQKLGATSAVISHSRTGVLERAKEALKEGELLLNQ